MQEIVARIPSKFIPRMFLNIIFEFIDAEVGKFEEDSH